MNTLINQSAGVLLYRRNGGEVEFFLAHPGGPFYVNKDSGVWSIPKGGVNDGEMYIDAAKREFFEETGVKINVPISPIGTVTLKSGKLIHGFLGMQDIDLTNLSSNQFEVHGKKYPEIDNWGWFTRAIAVQKIHPAQISFLDSVQ